MRRLVSSLSLHLHTVPQLLLHHQARAQRRWVTVEPRAPPPSAPQAFWRAPWTADTRTTTTAAPGRSPSSAQGGRYTPFARTTQRVPGDRVQGPNKLGPTPPASVSQPHTRHLPPRHVSNFSLAVLSSHPPQHWPRASLSAVTAADQLFSRRPPSRRKSYHLRRSATALPSGDRGRPAWTSSRTKLFASLVCWIPAPTPDLILPPLCSRGRPSI